MERPNPKKIHFHFIGVGGIGMSALAAILASKGFSVSGSDIKPTKNLSKLKDKGITILEKQNAENINIIVKKYCAFPKVVFSSAISTTNEELIAAKKEKLEILHRSEVLAYLLKEQFSIAVAGSHGKTTISTLITTLLALNKKDPTAIVGGIIPYYNNNNNTGKGNIIVAEADESDGSLVRINSDIGIINNIDLDHTDHYKNLDDLITIMKTFKLNCQQIIMNYDCKNINTKLIDDNSILYSIKDYKNARFAGIPIILEGNQTTANYYEHGKLIDKINIPLPGKHNLTNCIAAIASCRILGIPFEDIKNKLKYIEAPKRRFDICGTWKKRQIIDDYAHHPNEIKATTELARLMINNKNTQLLEIPTRLVIIFQPHRFTRTRDLMKDFSQSFNQADHVFLTPIYSAGEPEINGISSKILASNIKKQNPTLKVDLAKDFNELIDLLNKKTFPNDLLLAMGAGNISSFVNQLAKTKD